MKEIGLIRWLRSGVSFLAATVITASFYGLVAAAADAPKTPLPLKVVGTRIVTSGNEPVTLKGVNTASLEWTSNGERHILRSA